VAVPKAIVDAPGAAGGADFGTAAISINPAGATTGVFTDASGGVHGFLRTFDGAFTTFDAPDAAQFTFPNAINPAGDITGSYGDANFLCHGYLRSKNGAFTTFDVPDSQGATFAFSINPGGVIAGYYFDSLSNEVQYSHGFVRETDGTITTFAPPGFVGGLGNLATPLSIDQPEAIVGSYFRENGASGFLRTPDGTFTTFDPPGSDNNSCGASGTNTSGINPNGVITGYYSDKNCFIHGFLFLPQ
jgi:hypothetical protein